MLRRAEVILRRSPAIIIIFAWAEESLTDEEFNALGNAELSLKLNGIFRI